MKRYFLIIPLFLLLALGCSQKEAEKSANSNDSDVASGVGTEKPDATDTLNLTLKVEIGKMLNGEKIVIHSYISDNQPDFKDVAAVDGMKVAVVAKGEELHSGQLEFNDELSEYFYQIVITLEEETRNLKDLKLDGLKYTALDVDKTLSIELDKDFILSDMEGKIIKGPLSWDRNTFNEEILFSKLEALADSEAQFFNLYEMKPDGVAIKPLIAQQKPLKIAEGKAKIDLKEYLEKIKSIKEGNVLCVEVGAWWIKKDRWELIDSVAIVNPVIVVKDSFTVKLQ